MENDLVIKTKLSRYLLLRDEQNAIKKEMEDVKEELKPYLKQGRENAAGSRVLDLDNPLEHGGKVYPAVQHTRKVSRSLNEERVFEWLETQPEHVQRRIIVEVKTIDADALWDAFVDDTLEQDTLDSFFDEKITWAFTPISE